MKQLIPHSRQAVYLLLLYLCTYGLAYGQEKLTVSGVVRDADGPLVGVTVWQQDSQYGTHTDSEGRYQIYVARGSHLVFEYIGYKKQTHRVEGRSLHVTLQPDEAILDEIVVNAGYYSVKDRERTGSIARVTAKDMEFQPVINPLQAIQGRMAGVNITQESGTPGGGFEIQIRGLNSLQRSGNVPLYIIDGVPINNDYVTASLSKSILNTGISPLNSINPSDIESIEILKDADATAIYGSRGANGVVLITTKKGKAGKTNFTVSSSTAFSKVGRFMKLMNTEQFNQMRDEAFANDGITEYPPNAYDMNGAWDRNRYTDWQKELIGNTALSNNISLDISGGNEYTKFIVSLAHNQSTTVFPTDKGYKRNSASIGFNHRSKDNRFQLGTSTVYSVQSNDLPAADLTNPALTLAPNAPQLYNEDGTLNWQDGTFQNPLAQLNKTYGNNTKTLVLNTNLSYRLLSDVYLKLNAGITNNYFDEQVLTPHTIVNPALGHTSERSQSQKSYRSFNSYLIEPQLEWNKKTGVHTFSILMGSSYQVSNNNGYTLTGKNFSSNALITNISAAKERIINQINSSEYKYAALFARVNYSYNDKYILNLTGRRDGSSRFGNNYKFGNFGAVGAAWIFTEENFLKKSRWLSFGKLRASYGTTGSDNIGDYAYLDTYTAGGGYYNSIFGLYPTRLFNPDYHWEKTTKRELAAELNFFNDRIRTSAAYYNNRSSNQLIGLQLPSTTGFNTITANSPATVENSGWELTLGFTPLKTKNWTWESHFNISYPKNKLIAFPDLEESTYKNTYVIGKSINLVKLYHYEGIDPETGLYIFTDYNEDGKFTVDDKQIVKELDPKYYGGWQNTLSYKNFAFDFLFQFVKQDNYNLNANYNVPGIALQNAPEVMTDRWSPDNPYALYGAAATAKNSEAINQMTPFRQSDRTVSDASFIRLKNASLSYVVRLPKAQIESLRLYVQGQNLLTFTNYLGMDPEFINTGYIPPLRTYALGMQLTF